MARGDWLIAGVATFDVSAKGIKRQLDEAGTVREHFGGSSKLIVPKTMAVGDRLRSFNPLALYTSRDHENYNIAALATALGYDLPNSLGLSHIGVDTQQTIGRRIGECSIVLASDYLVCVATVMFSDQLVAELRRKHAIVAYPLSNQQFFCAKGGAFLEQYFAAVPVATTEGGVL